MTRITRFWLVGVPGTLVAVWLGSLAAVVAAAGRDDARPSAAIVVLGAAQYAGRPSPVLRARLDHAIDLWRQGFAPRLVVTGGRGAGDTMSEAAVARRYAIRHGVPAAAIMAETAGRTTSESLRAAAGMLKQTSAAGPAAVRPSVILVSDPFHMLRLGVLARRYGLTAHTSPTRTSPISASPKLTWQYMLRESLKVPFVFLTEKTSDE